MAPPNYLIFQPLLRYFKLNNKNSAFISSWKSRGLSDETIEPPSTSNISPMFDFYDGSNLRINFIGPYLKQSNRLTYTKKINIYIVYELKASSSNDNDPTLKNCLFGAVTLTKNADIEKDGYSGFGTGFGRTSSFSFPGGGFGQNILIFGEDMSSSPHIDNKKKDILVFGKGPTQGLEHTLTAEKIYFG